ncbi:MAG: hypothetical protein ABL921_12670 [Pirellula sp.]
MSSGAGSDDARDSQGKHAIQDAIVPILEARLENEKDLINDQELERLHRVARESESKGLAFDAFVVELVRELLQNRLPSAVVSALSIPHMSEMIGSTLCSDPVSRQRLLELQQQLLGGK